MAPPREPKPRRKQRKKSGAFFKRHHGTLAILIVLGWLVPPLAVLVRFGIGFDFFLNIILTCLGYFPGHAHNFYLQNLRNNQGRGRTPKWALKAGLVQDETEYIKSTRAWGSRYDERNTRNAYDDDNRPYEDEFGNPITPAEAFIENHGIKPAQPAGGLGERGNDTMHYQRGGGSAGGGGDLLDGLPDEDRARRKREKANRRIEYGSGLDEQDQWEADQAARNANGSSGRYTGDSLLGDLEDPDAVARPLSNSRSNNPYANRGGYGSDDYSRESRTSQGSVLPATKKSGRSKKSERYGIKSDHADLASTGSSNYGRSSNSRKAERNNDAYDIVDDDRRRSSRRTSGEEDFMNHQF